METNVMTKLVSTSGKQCTCCGEVKALTEFYKKKASKDGLQSYCKSCVKAQVKAYYEANRKEKKVYGKAYREANKDKVKTKKKAYHEANRGAKAIYNRKHRLQVQGVEYSLPDSFWDMDHKCPVTGKVLNMKAGVGKGMGNFGAIMWSPTGSLDSYCTYVLHPKYKNLFANLNNDELIDFSLWVLNDFSPLYRAPKLQEDKKVFMQWFHSIKHRAAKQDIYFDLNPFTLVVPQVCPVLGIPLERGIGGSTPHSPSVDRLVSELGYTDSNINVVSNKVNTAKANLTVDDMYEITQWLTSVALYAETEQRIKELHDDITNQLRQEGTG
jgi:hypothetical protein